MTAATPVDRSGRLVFSAWSAVSPYGIGGDAFAAGVVAGRDATTELDQETYPGPYPRAGLVPEFTAAGALGRKGTRTMDRVTAIAVSAVGQLISDCGPELLAEPDRVGLVLGTGSGSVQSIMDFTKDSLTGVKPYHVDPALFPNTVMNRAAGQSAIWHGIKGPNTTIAGGALTGLLALSYAVRLYRGGHCDRALLGAAEEYSVQRAWLEWHGRTRDGAAPTLGEGGAVFLLEPSSGAESAGRVPLATVLATRFRAFGDAADARQAVADCVRAALTQAGVSAADVRLVAPAGGEFEAVEDGGVTDALDGGTPEFVRCGQLFGDTSAATASFQLAAVLAKAGGGIALVTGVDRDGTVGCAVLELAG
ncbi:MAG TPA: beta-ketoacyl synthase N-terminal-like domain-containing protein [Umezawaea sp.]|nr:beta-ketoacyl synthase N-terminal-like domain-containing protein [Umezawaea sp.]